MKVAFRKSVLAPHRTEMLAEREGDWDLLKLHMCREWDVERAFDTNYVWELLREGYAVLVSGSDDSVNGYLFWLYDDWEYGEESPGKPEAVTLFSGELRLIEIDEMSEQ